MREREVVLAAATWVGDPPRALGGDRSFEGRGELVDVGAVHRREVRLVRDVLHDLFGVRLHLKGVLAPREPGLGAVLRDVRDLVLRRIAGAIVEEEDQTVSLADRP